MMKNEILQLLKKNEEFISGQQLCDHFQVSRTAVWKVMEQLKKEGYEIEAVRNRGYRLKESPDVVSEAEILSFLDTKWAGRKVICYKETDSTNNRAKESGEKGGAHGTLFVSDKQSAGKGRRGRTWESPEGTSIYMTLLLRPDLMPDKAPMLTLVMGLAAVEGIRETSGACAQIKWPNDIVIDGKKVCGILTEMATEIDYINYVVIGVGINANERRFAGEIENTAVSIRLATGRSCMRAKLIASVLRHFEKNYELFLKSGDLSGLQADYNKLLVNRGQDVRVLEPGHEYEARAEGISETGELIVTLPGGEKRRVFSGEVSVRGIYGYV